MKRKFSLNNKLVIKGISKNLFCIILLSFLLISIFLLTKSDVNAECRSDCFEHDFCGCVGDGGCVYRGTCNQYEASLNCGEAGTMCCDRGYCESCTPVCDANYQSSDNGCSAASFSCTKYDCIGSCGTASITCYRKNIVYQLQVMVELVVH